MPVESNNQESTYYVGLDVGTKKIACVVLELTHEGEFNIVGNGITESSGVNYGMVANIEQTMAGIKRVVAMATESSNIDINDVVVGISGEGIRTTKHQIPFVKPNDSEITRADVDKMVKDVYNLNPEPGYRTIHVMPIEFVVDGMRLTDPIGVPGNRVEGEFFVILAPERYADNLERSIKRAGINAQRVVMQSTAAAYAIVSPAETKAGVAVVDFGAGTTGVSVFHKGLLQSTSIIPFGGAIITEDIADGMQILPDFAENLKKEYGYALAESAPDGIVSVHTGLPDRKPAEVLIENLARIIEARCVELASFVHNEIIDSGYEGRLNTCGIVLTGGSTNLREIANLFKLVTGLPVRVGNPAYNINTSKSNEVFKHEYAGAIGLAIAGTKHLPGRDELMGINTQSEKSTKPTQTAEKQKPEEKKSWFAGLTNILIDKNLGQNDI